jgi:hypothetical protein
VGVRKSISVTRANNPTPDACVRALQVLIHQPVMKMTDRPAPEPVGRDGTKVKEDSANVILPE